MRPLPRIGCSLAATALVLLSAQPAADAFQRDLIDTGFRLDQLIALSGAGADPGPANPEMRLDWAVTTAIPAQWRLAVPVVWSIDEVPSGSLALSFYDGTVSVSPRLMQRSAEVLLATVAHEMGHQIAISLVPAGDGSPPRGFLDAIPGNPYNRFDEGWADCVSRVWTGSLHYTRSEPAPCPVDAARYVASLLTDPQNLRREGLPLPSASPSPSVAPSLSPIPEPALSPTPRDQAPVSQRAAGRGEREPAGVPVALLVIAAILVLLGPPILVKLVRVLVPDEIDRKR